MNPFDDLEITLDVDKMIPGAKVKLNTELYTRREIRAKMRSYGVNDVIIGEMMNDDLEKIYTVSKNRSSHSVQLEEFKGMFNGNIHKDLFVLMTREIQLLAQAEEL